MGERTEGVRRNSIESICANVQEPKIYEAGEGAARKCVELIVTKSEVHETGSNGSK